MMCLHCLSVTIGSYLRRSEVGFKALAAPQSGAGASPSRMYRALDLSQFRLYLPT